MGVTTMNDELPGIPIMAATLAGILFTFGLILWAATWLVGRIVGVL